MKSKHSNIDEQALWQSFKQGDTKAFEQLYNQYFKVLGAYGLRLSHDTTLVEDAIHDVFIELWRRREFLSDVENLKFYLFRALRNQFHGNLKNDILDKNEDINQFLDYLSTISSEQEIIVGEETQLIAQQIEKAINKLSNRGAEAINLRFYQGLSLDETSEIMQTPKQVVKNLLSKSIAILRVSLKKVVSFTAFLSLLP
ncbi:sigma-70 family RNA polymerase sigma factor [Emticicia sp. W12TSBA100-4]|uniref:RNA polymerase sigma factor n=1 Tax=Emticicia sp. W12TSBA100-4 TaxID=3160965 RepID=UPI0033068A21